MIDVVLNEDEIREADAYAEQVERETAARRAAPTQVGIRRSQSWGNKMGYRAQRAFCAALGIRWQPKAAFDGPNVGSIYKVRGSQRRAGIVAALKVTERDRDDLMFVKVTSEDKIAFRLEGWVIGRDAKRPEWLRDHGYPSYTVPDSALNPMATLPIDSSVTIWRKPAAGEGGAVPVENKLA